MAKKKDRMISTPLQLMNFDNLPYANADLVWSADEYTGFARETVKIDSADTKIRVRRLTRNEMDILVRVFKWDLNYDRIRVHIGGIFTSWGYSRGVGNRICVLESDIVDGEVTRGVLIHEAAHVWQYQRKMKWTYAPKAIGQHFKAIATLGGYDPYAFKHLERKVPWDLWEPEQQAQYIEYYEKLPSPDILNPER